MKFVKKVETLLNREFHTFVYEDLLKINDLFADLEIPDSLYLQNRRVLSHSLGTARLAGSLCRDYLEGIEIPDKDRVIEMCILGGFLHDLGKTIVDGVSVHDSLNIELFLREHMSPELAQSVRHNPYLFLFDFRNGNLSVPQLIVAQADTYINAEGEKVDREERLNFIIEKKKINGDFQRYYWQILNDLYTSKGVRSIDSQLRVSFVERCDGRYRISEVGDFTENLSSFHVAKSLQKMGYLTTILGDTSHDFIKDGVRFIPTGNSIYQVYNQVRKNDFIYITGWVSLAKHLVKNNNVLPMVIFRSLKQSSLDKARLLNIYSLLDRSIFVSKSSVKYLNLLLSNQQLRLKKSNTCIIPNGINKEVFFYKEERIKKQFVYVGAIVKEKGVIDVIELARKLPNFKCKIIGESIMYGNSRKTELSGVRIPRNVEFLGQLNQKQIAKIYRESLFSVYLTDSSLIFETFGKSSAESQSCGCPVIYSDNGGLSEFAIRSLPNKEFKATNILEISKYILKNEAKFANTDLRVNISQKINTMILGWNKVATLYISKSYEVLMEVLRKRLNNRNLVDEYLTSS